VPSSSSETGRRCRAVHCKPSSCISPTLSCADWA
jgi:hypothetical protein